MKIYKAQKTERQSIALTNAQYDARKPLLQVEKNRLFISASDLQIEILEVQVSGKKRMAARDFANGLR